MIKSISTLLDSTVVVVNVVVIVVAIIFKVVEYSAVAPQ